ncbi:MAG: hypothetical protein Ct9H300mP22_6650 [Gammaproteobacteria bacterium]|nr:MAG: hypothetical protein Ct9H300mP22_6650 [Gammaproteobacteria bacterium]
MLRITFAFLLTSLFALAAIRLVSEYLYFNHGNYRRYFLPCGVALSTLVSAQEDVGFSLSSISSAGSMENIKLMRDNQAQFAILLGIFGAWAYEGSGPIRNPYKNFRSISAMWPNVEHFILRSDLVSDGGVRNISGIDGERFSIGMRNSGAEYTALYFRCPWHRL